jgi:mevalonate pyrophosphate decarboxylase
MDLKRRHYLSANFTIDSQIIECVVYNDRATMGKIYSKFKNRKIIFKVRANMLVRNGILRRSESGFIILTDKGIRYISLIHKMLDELLAKAVSNVNAQNEP